MRFSAIWCPTFLVVLLLTSCGGTNHSHMVSRAVGHPLVVLMGGFNSCAIAPQHGDEYSPLNMQMQKFEEPIRNELAQKFGVTFDVMASCFTMNNELRVTSSDDWGNLEKNVDVSDYTNRVRDRIERHSQVFVIGHSYGGWLAMQTLAGYQGSEDRIKTLYTLDPISRNLCRFNDPWNWTECIKAPGDFSAADRNHIRSKTMDWLNIYQTTTPFLHATEISEAHQNRQFNVQHWLMENQPEVWSTQRADLERSLSGI